MKKRILSFFLLWAIAFSVMGLAGTPGAVALIAAGSFLTQREIYLLLARIGPRASIRLGLTLGFFISVGSYYGAIYGIDLAGTYALAVVITVIAHLLRPISKREFKVIAATLFGLSLGPLMLGFFGNLIWLSEQMGFHAMVLPVWVIAVAKFADVGGLITGRFLGRTPLAPNLSPKKTREGAAGGVLWSVIVGAGAVALFPQHFPAALTPLIAGLIAVPVAIAGIASDLFESAIKREAGVKDSGKLIPGIGGAFDLTDSLLLAAPVAYFLLARVLL